jgi:PAS domain-containing protein
MSSHQAEAQVHQSPQPGGSNAGEPQDILDGVCQDQTRTSLPGNGRVWEQSQIGVPGMWSEMLKAYSKTIASLAYPACIFWGEDMIILHNCKWTKANGVYGQGRDQRSKVSMDTFNALSTSLHGGIPKRVDSRAFLRDLSADQSASYTVLISLLFDDAKGREDGASGSLVQLIPNPELSDQAKMNSRLPKKPGEDLLKCDISWLGEAFDNIAFGEHPFFHRFAETLPTGLAILDHRPQAVFVNQNFYQLTTHRGADQGFKSWLQSIHPDDYDRAMQVYHDAFLSQTQVRTKFRALGQPHPWRLLFLTPLGDDDLQHVSLRKYGGFICSVVDITSEKSAEHAERKAAKDARERKE